MLRANNRIWIIAVLAFILAVGWALDYGFSVGEDTYALTEKNMDNLWEVYRRVVSNYFQEVAPDEILIAGIEGMLGRLDPYSQFLSESFAVEQLRIDTRGKFGGLGISITVKDDVPTVIWTLEGTPADRVGLLAGDRIIKIEGDPTEGKSLREVVSLLRGEPGTEVNITVEREGEREPIEFAIERDEIRIKSVTFADEIEDGVGYIRMARTRFSDETGEEVEEALRKLREGKVRGIILDLRGNPGGLLSQALEVADKFLERGQLVVYTEGRAEGQNRRYLSEEDPIIREVPLVVLVNGGSASASEIVAGAIQDSHRGLILGTPTFGKGSVQTVYGISGDTALKLTTALYFTPSGRSIHKEFDGKRRRDLVTIAVGDKVLRVSDLIDVVGQSANLESARGALMERFRLGYVEAQSVLNMDLGDLVGLQEESVGGITPDVEVEPEIPRFAEELERRRVFFSFAVHYAALHPEIERDFQVDDEVIAEFKDFLADSTRKFDYRVAGEAQLDELEEIVNRGGYGQEAMMALKELKDGIEAEEVKDFEESLGYIRQAIKREIASRMWGTEARIRATFPIDSQLQAAVEILKDPVRYAEEIEATRIADSR